MLWSQATDMREKHSSARSGNAYKAGFVLTEELLQPVFRSDVIILRQTDFYTYNNCPSRELDDAYVWVCVCLYKLDESRFSCLMQTLCKKVFSRLIRPHTQTLQRPEVCVLSNSRYYQLLATLESLSLFKHGHILDRKGKKRTRGSTQGEERRGHPLHQHCPTFSSSP